MSPEIIEQPFRLTQADPVISAASGVSGSWSDIWKYQVPVGMSLIIKPNHTFAAYLHDGEECGTAVFSDCSVRIEKRDASESDVEILFGPKLYKSIRNFTPYNRMAKFSVPEEGKIINEREYLVIVALNDGTLTGATTSFFEMHIAKIRKAIGA